MGSVFFLFLAQNKKETRVFYAISKHRIKKHFFGCLGRVSVKSQRLSRGLSKFRRLQTWLTPKFFDVMPLYLADV